MSWYYYKRALLSDKEIHKDIVISKKEANSLLKFHKAFFLRYTTNFDQKYVSPAYYIIKDSWNGFDELSSNARTQVRKAFRMCDVKRINNDILISQGYEVYKENMTIHRENDSLLNPETYIQMICNTSSRDLFGCFDRQTDELIGYARNIVGEGVNYSGIKAKPKFFKTHYPFYALFYKMNEYYLYECKKKYVCDGFRTIDNHSNIQNFLIEKFKFRKAYCKLHIHYVWWLKLIVNCLYPFRKFITIDKIRSLLFQEEISRKSIT
ncbi:MAG: hypothetical protein JXB49_30585 [Bacteroidales bacterium]|nr:hypothetical protein [Bacteroidales bacterium]